MSADRWDRRRGGGGLRGDRTRGRGQQHDHHDHHDHHHDDCFLSGPGFGPDFRHHHPFWLRQSWRTFSGVHLRRRLFLWFGATIFLTALVVGSLVHVTRMGPGRPHIPGFAFLLVPIAILWAAAGKVARRIARPLDELVRVAEDIGAGRLDARARLHCGGLDEIAALSRAVNEMAARIERQLGDQRELLAGVSHEIRTPLARLRLLVEIGRERGPGATDLDEIERELIEIDNLVGQLLACARLDFAALQVMPLDAGEVASRAAERAGVPRDRLLIEAADPRFMGDPTLLGRALANLLQNAAIHGSGVDALRVTGGPAAIQFSVLDHGPGFPPGEEGRVFERFYRSGPAGAAGGDGARSRRAEGLGLGLALVRRIADAHGGTVAARNRQAAPGAEAHAPVPGAEVSFSIPRLPRGTGESPRPPLG